MAQVHAGCISLHFVKETSGYIQNVPSGHLAGHTVKAITMYPSITLRSKWWAHYESSLDEWLRSHAGHIVSHILKQTTGFFHKVPPGHLAEYIVKELNMCLPVTCWLNFLKNHNVITMETLGKWGSAPSDQDLLEYLKLDDVIKQGHVSRMEDLLPSLLYHFQGGSNKLYVIEIMELLQKLDKEWMSNVK